MTDGPTLPDAFVAEQNRMRSTRATASRGLAQRRWRRRVLPPLAVTSAVLLGTGTAGAWVNAELTAKSAAPAAPDASGELATLEQLRQQLSADQQTLAALTLAQQSAQQTASTLATTATTTAPAPGQPPSALQPAKPPSGTAPKAPAAPRVAGPAVAVPKASTAAAIPAPAPVAPPVIVAPAPAPAPPTAKAPAPAPPPVHATTGASGAKH